jgi:hypothetical protein
MDRACLVWRPRREGGRREKFILPDRNERRRPQLAKALGGDVGDGPQIPGEKPMTARATALCTLFLSCGLAGAAAAATTSPAPAGSAGDQNAAPNPQAATHISQKLRADLARAGFTDITIMPSSFLVRAKDSEGNPVMMVINPDSLTEVTEHSEGTGHDEAPLAGAIKGEPNSPIPSPAPKQ